MAAPEDVNVDELRRRARRRLVGAIVLALAVAVLVPMLLESDPKPLGEDVSVKIPPVDEGKFVNRLNDKAKAEPAKSGAAKPEPKTEPKVEPKAEPKLEPLPKATEAEPAEPAKVDVAKAEPSKVETPPPPAAEPAPAPKTAAPVSVAPKAAPASAPAAMPAPAPHEAASGEFSVQLAAFSDDKGANSLANKLKKAGYPAYTEPLATSRGTLWRVRVGPFTSRDSAVASREKLKGDGYSGIVAAAK